MRDLDKAEHVLVGLQTMGVRIALDNFGTGIRACRTCGVFR